MARYERPLEIIDESIEFCSIFPEDWEATVDATKLHLDEGAKEIDEFHGALADACD